MTYSLHDQNAIEVLEESLVSTIRGTLFTDPVNLTNRLKEVQVANNALHSLGSSGVVDYQQAEAAEAYALKFHLMRSDNALVAINAATKFLPLNEWSPILDFGSGTGSVAWALAGLTSVNNHLIEVIQIEESNRMAMYRSQLWKGIVQSKSLSSVPRVVCDAGQLVGAVVASHVFAVPDDLHQSDIQVKNLVDTAFRLKMQGTFILLTPNVPAKLGLADKTVSCLVDQGFTLLVYDEWADKAREITTAKSHRPEKLCDFRRELDAIGRHCGLGRIFREPDFDDPYFGFYCRLDILRREC